MKDLEKFEAEFEPADERCALEAHGVFMERFPLDSLEGLTLDEYVVGHNRPTFCGLAGPKTKKWANIESSLPIKFGIYFGGVKSDPTRIYRFAKKFGTNEQEAFAAVKAALRDLVALGAAETLDCVAIDANRLSQMFKAKILSLYYPDRFAAVCNADHLKVLAEILEFPKKLPVSAYQNRLIEEKRANPRARDWSAPKFMAYLYAIYELKDRRALKLSASGSE